MSQDQIRTLGTFITPGRLDKFLNIYHKATARPRGYLLIDAKHNTPESERFKTNILGEGEKCTEKQDIKGSNEDTSVHLMFDNQSEHISDNMVSCDELRTCL